MNERYQVRDFKGMGTGAGMFQVLDTRFGQGVGKAFYWRGEADASAARMNNLERFENQNAGAQQDERK